MKIRFRKLNGFRLGATDLYEWQPIANGNDHWYTVHRRDILFWDGNGDYERYVYNQALQGETVILRAVYMCGSWGKCLCVQGGELA